jgi:hypothetical protein
VNTSIKNLFFIGLLAFLSSCCANVSEEKSDVSNSGTVLRSPTSIAINRSVVAAKVEEVFNSENGSYIVKALVTHVDEDPSYQSLAMPGRTYNLIPNFQLDENKKVIADSEKNKSLISISKLKEGDEFKAVIFFDNMNGWFIQNVISN